MKIIEYKCNLCGDKKDRLEISGVYFSGGSDLHFRDPMSCESHLCHKCEEAVALRHSQRPSQEKAIAP